MNIKSKLLIACMSVGVIAVALTGWQSYRNAQQALEEAAFDRLTITREIRKRQIESYFTQIRNQVITFSEDRMIVEAMKQFKSAIGDLQTPENNEQGVVRQYYVDIFDKKLRETGVVVDDTTVYAPVDPVAVYLQYHYIANNPNPTGEKQTLDFAFDSSTYSQAHGLFHPIIRNYLQTFGYYDIFLIDADTGRIVYSVFKEVDYATSLKTGPYQESNLAIVFRDAVEHNDPNFAKLADFEPYLPSYNAPAAFIASPIFDGANKIGVLAFQMPIDRIDATMTSNQSWLEDGLGESGETYIVASDYTMRNNSRFIIQDPTGFFAALTTIGSDSALIAKMQRYHTTIGLQEVHTYGVEAALNKQTDTRIIDDYRGIPVLSAFTPLDIQDANWVLLAEIDAAEIFAPAEALRNRIAFIGLILALGVGVLATIIASSISNPIRRLTHGVTAFGEGDLSRRIDIASQDEVGQLTTSFNTMADAIERDQKEILAAKEDAEESRKQAEQANDSKSTFLANMSHEIRTPMNAILGFSEILEKSVQDSQQKNYLDAIQTSGKSLLTLINDILDLSKVEAGKLDIQYGPVDPHIVFRDMAMIFAQKVDEKGVDFDLHIDDSVPPALIMDEVRLRQILMNLISNAVKFTNKGYVRLAVRSEYESGASEMNLVMDVEDTGIGIPDDQQDKIFGAFEQTQGQSVNQYGGTGLGLAISRRLADLMNGIITLKSEWGKGSTFTVTLRDVPVASTADIEALDADAIDPDTITFSPATILIVDDIEINRDLVKAFLEPYDFSFLEAENGKESVDQGRASAPDLVLMDMSMPEMDGFEATRAYKTDTRLKDIPIVALTASIVSQTEEEIAELCDSYLRKPVSRSQLIGEMIQYLDHKIKEDVPVSMGEDEEVVSLTPEVIAQLPELVEKLDAEKSLWEDLVHTQTINGIENFAANMETLADEYSYPPLKFWSSALAQHVALFDLDAMASKLNEFPVVIDDIRSVSS